MPCPPRRPLFTGRDGSDSRGSDGGGGEVVVNFHIFTHIPHIFGHICIHISFPLEDCPYLFSYLWGGGREGPQRSFVNSLINRTRFSVFRAVVLSKDSIFFGTLDGGVGSGMLGVPKRLLAGSQLATGGRSGVRSQKDPRL